MKHIDFIINYLKLIWDGTNIFEKFMVCCAFLIVLSTVSCSVNFKLPETKFIGTEVISSEKLDEPVQVIDNGETKEYIFKKDIDGEIQTITVTGEGVSVVVNK